MSNSIAKTSWNTFLMDEFDKESDRASALLVGAVLDEILKSLLRRVLVPSPNSHDDFLEGSTAVIATLGARIDLIYRLGLISSRMCRDLHVIRKIRDEFAHDVANATYDKPSIEDRILLLHNSSGDMVKQFIGTSVYPDTARGKFRLSASWRLWLLDNLEVDQPANEIPELEWGYTADDTDDDVERLKAAEKQNAQPTKDRKSK